LRYSSALLPKSFERPGPKSVSPATNCSGVDVVVWWRWIVDFLERCHTSYGSLRERKGYRTMVSVGSEQSAAGAAFCVAV